MIVLWYYVYSNKRYDSVKILLVSLHYARLEKLGLSAGTGKLCIFGNLGLPCSLYLELSSFLSFISFYVSLHYLCFGTHRRNQKLKEFPSSVVSDQLTQVYAILLNFNVMARRKDTRQCSGQQWGGNRLARLG